jgi:hypothetical protein
MAEVDREWIVRELRALLVALASPGQVALGHEPRGSCRPDELALDYDNFVHAYLNNFSPEISAHQRSALLRVDALFSAMSEGRQPDLWTEDAVIAHPRWAEVRAAAQQALDAMSWAPE